jgi:hypothetical protein
MRSKRDLKPACIAGAVLIFAMNLQGCLIGTGCGGKNDCAPTEPINPDSVVSNEIRRFYQEVDPYKVVLSSLATAGRPPG